MNAESTREALDVASLAGDILLASGAEIFRVEETIDRIARAYGVKSSDAFVLSSGIFLTAESGKKQEFARVRHIPLSAARLDKVTAVNQLSREIEEGLHTPKEAKAWLLDIQRMPEKPKMHQVLASGVGSACFCFLFGGDVVDSMVAFLSGFVLYVYLLYLLRGRMSKIATNISGGALVTLIAVFLYQAGIGHHLDKVIIGSIIPLVPGVNFTNAIRDIADQDYIAGSVRMLDALPGDGLSDRRNLSAGAGKRHLLDRLLRGDKRSGAGRRKRVSDIQRCSGDRARHSPRLRIPAELVP